MDTQTPSVAGDIEQTKPDRLTLKRSKLLRVLRDHQFETVTDLCKAAGVSRDTYYESLKDDAFVGELKQEGEAILYTSLVDIMRSIARRSKAGSFPHQQLALKFLQLYQDKPDVLIDQSQTFIIKRGVDERVNS